MMTNGDDIMDVFFNISDAEEERWVLGAMMNDRQFVDYYGKDICEDMFTDGYNRDVYRAIMSLCSHSRHVDMMLVRSEMTAMGMTCNVAKLAAIYSMDPLYQGADEHVARLMDLYRKRRVERIAYALKHAACAEHYDTGKAIKDAMDGFADLSRSNTGNVHTLQDALKAVLDIIGRNFMGDGAMTGSPTGFRRFDSRGGGLQASDLVVIAGESSQGKSSFAASIARNVAGEGDGVAIYTMEMTKEQYAARFLAGESDVDNSDILYKRLTDDQYARIDRSVGILEKLPIYFDDTTTSSLESILSSIRSLHIKYGIKGAVVDYIQMLTIGTRANPEQELAEIARRLKNIAKELGIWVIAVSQLNRDRDNPEPSLARLRGSGQINEAADVTILVYRPEIYGRQFPGEFSGIPVIGRALIDVAKGRNIGLMKFVVRFDANTTRFYDEDDRPPVPLAGPRKPDDDDDAPF